MQERFETFTVLINRISRNIRKIKNQEMTEYKLRSPHISCLYYLYENESLTATELCERCEEDKATMSRSIEHLEENGFITCDTKTKRYKSPLTLTEKGMVVAEKITSKVNLFLDSIGASLSEEERLTFYRCLSLISESLDRICNEAEVQ